MSIDYRLSHGSHDSPKDGLCAMEWVAYLAGEEHSDSPKCVDPPLRAFGISLNDNWDDEQRQKLRPYLARCIGTAGDGRTEERGWLATDWLIRTFTPAFLDLRPELKGHAEKLRSLSPVMAMEALDEANILLAEAKKDAAAAGAAAWDAAWAAAGAAARDAARDAAWAAAGAAARDAVWAAARDAAGAAAGAAAWAAVWAAARDALEPTVKALQDSALDLFDRMLPTEPVPLPQPARAEYERLLEETPR